MATRAGTGVVEDLYQRGVGALAVAKQNVGPQAPAAPAKPMARAAPPAATQKSTVLSDSSGKARKRTREQRMVLALARLLASRMR